MSDESVLFEQHPNPMFIYDRDSLNILKANNAALSKYGYSREEFESLSLEEIRPREDIDSLHENIASLEGGMSESRVITHQRKDGTQFYVQVNSNYFSYKGYNSRLVVVHDISKEVEARKEVEDTYRELDGLIQNNPLAMIKLDSNFSVIEWSGRAEEISGYPREEMIGRSILATDLFDPETGEIIKERLLDIREGLGPEGLDIRISTKRGEPVDLRLHTSVLRKSDGGVRSVMIFAEDISATLEAERKLKRKSELITFVNELSHSINSVETYQEALELVIQEICDFIDWPVGHAYTRNADGNFVSSNFWYINSEKNYSAFKQLSKATFFKKGKGFIGNVIKKEVPQWLTNIADSPEFIRQADKGELPVKTCFAFPVRVENNISIVLEFFHERLVEAESEFLDLYGTIGNQLGRILERSRAREELKINEQKYRRLFEQANDGIFILEWDEIIDCNKRILNIFNCEIEDIIGETPFEFSPEYQPDGEKSSAKGQDLIRKAQSGVPLVFEWKHKTKDGRLIDTEVGLSKLKLDGDNYVQAIIRDITSQKEAERALRKSEELFRNLFLRAPVAIVMVDQENRVKIVNQTFEELFGYEEEELLNRDLDQFIVPEDEYEKAPKMPAESILDKHYIKELTRVTRDDREIDVLVGAIPVYLEGEPLAGFGIYIDISEQKEVQRKLENSLQEKEILLKEIHHRVKNNLAVISALLQLQVLKKKDESYSVTGILDDSLGRIKTMALVHETLYETEDFANLRFSKYVENLIQLNVKVMEREEKDISFKYDVEDLALNINQAVPLALILNEMVSNAFKYAFESRNKGAVLIKIWEKSGTIYTSVKDDGIGLPDNFEELRENSLGMTLIDLLVRQLHGSLVVSDEGGTKFELSFRKEDRSGSSGHFFPSSEKI